MIKIIVSRPSCRPATHCRPVEPPKQGNTSHTSSTHSLSKTSKLVIHGSVFSPITFQHTWLVCSLVVILWSCFKHFPDGVSNSFQLGLLGRHVQMCSIDLNAAKPYHRRHKVCEQHAKASVVLVVRIQQRFCQQSSRFIVDQNSIFFLIRGPQQLIQSRTQVKGA